MLLHCCALCVGTSFVQLKYLAPAELNASMFDPVEKGTETKRIEQSLKEAREWIQKVFEKKIEPSIKSEEPLPENVNKGPLYVVSGRQFQSMVLDSKEDFLVDFYAPW